MSRFDAAMARLDYIGADNAMDGWRMASARGRFQALADRSPWSSRVAVADGLFITPPPIADRMVSLADLTNRDTVLETSAGTGRIIEAIRRARFVGAIRAVDNCRRLATHLSTIPGVLSEYRDFMGKDDESFSCIIMNPPFRRGSDIRHVMHARSLLSPGGRLVSLCYDGDAQNKHLRPIAKHWEVLPANSFAGEGTAACVAMLVMEADHA